MPAQGLQIFQTEIEAETLYAVEAHASVSLDRKKQSSVQLAPNIQVAGNAGDVYGSQTLPVSPPTDMTLMFDGLLNIAAFDYVPNYLYVDPVTDAPDAIILTGVEADEVE